MKIKNIEPDIYSFKDLTELLGNKMAVSRAIQSEELEKVGDSYYRVGDAYYHSYPYRILEKYYPDAVIALDSALMIRDLGEYEPDLVQVDIPNNMGARESEIFEFYRVSPSKMKAFAKVNVQGVSVNVYTPARCLFEAMRIEGGKGNTYYYALKKFIKSHSLNDVLEVGKAINAPTKTKMISEDIQNLNRLSDIF